MFLYYAVIDEDITPDYIVYKQALTTEPDKVNSLLEKHKEAIVVQAGDKFIKVAKSEKAFNPELESFIDGLNSIVVTRDTLSGILFCLVENAPEYIYYSEVEPTTPTYTFEYKDIYTSTGVIDTLLVLNADPVIIKIEDRYVKALVRSDIISPALYEHFMKNDVKVTCNKLSDILSEFI